MSTQTKPGPTPSTGSYAANYATLTAIAERLRNPGTATTVDSLVADVKAARAAHTACKSRLDAIRREIDSEISAAEAGPA